MSALLADFAEQMALESAVKALAEHRFARVETYTPMPREKQSAGSTLPLCMFVAGMLGFIGFFLLMTYGDVTAYPLDIGGRPKFSWPAFVPIAFELGVLCAMATGFFGFFIVCRMPQLYRPEDQCAAMRGATRDQWLVMVDCQDAQELAAARVLLARLAPVSIEEVPA